MWFCGLCNKSRKLINTSSDTKNDQYGVTSITGFKPGVKEWVNQDTFLVHENSENLKGGRHIYAVFDGHG